MPNGLSRAAASTRHSWPGAAPDDGKLYRNSKSLRVRVRKADHAVGGSVITTCGFTESRTSTDLSRTATCTQLPVLDAVLLRHAIHGSSNSVTRPPCRRVAGPPPAPATADACRASSQPAGVLVKLLPSEPAFAQECSIHSITVQCKRNRAIRLVVGQTASLDRNGHTGEDLPVMPSRPRLRAGGPKTPMAPAKSP